MLGEFEPIDTVKLGNIWWPETLGDVAPKRTCPYVSGHANPRTPDKKRTNVAGELRVSCVGIEIIYTIKVEYPAVAARL